MSILPSRQASDPEKRLAEEEIESERQKRLRVISEMKDSLRSEDLDPEIRVSLMSAIDDLRSKGLDSTAIGTEDWNQPLPNMESSLGEGVIESAPPITLEEEEEKTATEMMNIELYEDLDDMDADEDCVYVWVCGGGDGDVPGTDNKTRFPAAFCPYCMEVTDHYPMFCPIYKSSMKRSFNPDPPPQTPQQIADGRDYYCPICKDYTEHGPHRCPIENSVYEPLPDGGFKQTKCSVCRQPLHPERHCVFGSYLQ